MSVARSEKGEGGAGRKGGFPLTVRAAGWISLSVALTVLVAGGVALLVLPTDETVESARPGSYDPSLPQSYRVLRRSDARPLPAPLASAVLAAADNRIPAPDPGSAVPIGTGHGRIWMVAGTDSACIVQEDGAAVACGQIRAAVRWGLAIGVFDPPSRPGGRLSNFLVLGVAPDGVGAVRASVGSSEQVIPVRQNAYSIEAQRPVVVEGFVR